MWNDVLDLAARLRAEREPFVLATVVARDRPQSVPMGARAVIRSDGSLTGWVGGGCVRPVVVDESLEALRDGRPRLVRIGSPAEEGAPPGIRHYPMTCHGGGRVEVYVEPVQPKARLVVFGVTPVAQALTELAGALGYEIVVVDPAASEAAFPRAHRVLTSVQDAGGLLGEGTSVVVATQGEGDEEALESALSASASYVGLVASRKKGRAVMDFLAGRGVGAEALERVRSPAGLDLGGMEPPEIALSILAEIVAVRSGKDLPATGTSVSSEPVQAGHEGSLVQLGSSPSRPNGSSRMATDPVCNMKVRVEGARYVSEHEGDSVYFCCPMCQAAFEKDPAAYAVAD